MATAYISHPDCIKHNMSYGHPESPERLSVIKAALNALDLWGKLEHLEAPQATQDQLSRVHKKPHIERVFNSVPKLGLMPLDPDTSMGPDSLAAALAAAGAVILATDKVLAGEIKHAFCAVRPPGHHATSENAMGFCIFNNIAVGVAHALEQHKLKRIAVLDFDVHHGNGTEEIFQGDERVLYCSSHQHPHYPFTGAPIDDKTNIINTQLPAGTTSKTFQQAIQNDWFPAIESFKPELIYISAGFDAHKDDPLASLNFEDDDFYWITKEICQLAEQFAQGRIISSLEGGYNLEVLGHSVATHIKALLDN